MVRVGDVEMTSHEFAILEQLIEWKNKGKSLESLSSGDLLSRGKPEESELAAAYRYLADSKLIVISDEKNLPVCRTLAPRTEHLVKDVKEQRDCDAARVRYERRRSWLSVLAGAILGGILGLFSGSFSTEVAQVLAQIPSF